MLTIKLILLAIIFVFTGGAVFSEYFKKNKLLFILATLISIISSFYLFKSIYKDIVNEVATSTAIKKNELPTAKPSNLKEELIGDTVNKNKVKQTPIDNNELSLYPPLVMADIPPSKYYVMPTIGRQPDTSIRLSKVSEKPNQIINDEEWWIDNGLQSLTYNVPNPFGGISGNLPNIIPNKFNDLMIVKAIRSNPIIAIYGRNFFEGHYLLAIDPINGKKLFSFDFHLYKWPKSFDGQDKIFIDTGTSWAYVEGNTLYVSHSYITPSSSSHGQNAYLTAIDIPSNTILWRSKPLVSNINNFIIKGDAIITGYGFTNEKDYLYVLNKADGRIVQDILLKTGPSDLAEKNNKLYVRTYNTDYVFKYIAN
jgi:hypothetical protein